MTCIHINYILTYLDPMNHVFVFAKQIMTDTVKDSGIKRCCLVPNRLVDLQTLSDGLERCQKSLNDYLDSKRNAFPRFFFISDDELLSILGSSEPTCVQEHIIKVTHDHRFTLSVSYLPEFFSFGLILEQLNHGLVIVFVVFHMGK